MREETLDSPRNTQHAIRNAFHVSRISPDTAIGLLLFLAGFYAYTATLAPTVLEGDAALFQYTPYVLGVTYPTGYPLYILLGKIWLTLFPFGEIAWRMNLFSALCSAVALPLIYGAARRLLTLPDSSRQPEGAGGSERWAALATVLIFATLPTFWRWSTEAKIYALNILLFSGVLYTLALALEKQKRSLANAHPSPPNTQYAARGTPPGTRKQATRSPLPTLPLALPTLLLGLQISVHSTTVLLIPGLLLLIWFHFRRHVFNKKFFIIYSALLIAPGLLYFYIPLRAEWLIANYGQFEAISRGLLADFYHSGLAGWVRYFTAADFTGGVVTNWGLVPQQFLTVYLPLLTDDLTYLGAGLGLVGGLTLAVMQPRLFWPLFLLYVTPIPFVLTYGQGEQSAFLLPSFLIFSLFTGNVFILTDRLLATPAKLFVSGGITHHVSRFTFHVSRFTSLLLLFLILIPILFLPQTRYNVNWLDAKWSRASYEEWADALDHPMEPGAVVLAHWGDLTSFWYMQYAEQRRPDLRGLYPPTEEMVIDYLQAGRDLYIAGPLQGWVAGVEERYQLIPWGRLVRIAPRQVDPPSLLPSLSQPVEAIFDHKLRLVAVDYSPQAMGDSQYPVTLTWQTLAELPPETTISVRLSQGEVIAAQLDDTLLSGWFPRETLPEGQYVLSYVPLYIPLGTLPGPYRLQVVAYTSYKHPWLLADGTTELDLGEVEITLPPVDYQPDPEQFHANAGYDFNGEIELVDHEYNAYRIGQGKGFAVKLMWRAKARPVDNYTLLVEAVDAAGNVLRSVEHQPVGGRAPTASWQPGQFVRDQVDLVLPASAPVGPRALRVRLSWQRPNGSKLTVRRWLLPIGDGLNLEGLEVVEKEGRVFEVPEVQHLVKANLENKARLIGYNSPWLAEPDSTGRIQFSRADCAADVAACQIHFDFYWQGLSEMDLLYFVFLHVVDAQGQIVAQHDLGPGKRGKQPTTSWLPGEVVTDPVDLNLPANIAPGQYSMRLGMYLPPDGPRLLVLNDEGQAVADFVEIGMIEVRP